MGKRIPFWLTFFGVINIAVGLFYILTYLLPFLFAVVGGWVTDRDFYGYWDWFFMVVVDRFIMASTFVSSLFLVFSGYGILNLSIKARKTAIFSGLILVGSNVISSFSELFKSILYPDHYALPYAFWTVVNFTITFYVVSLIFYFNNERIKTYFPDNVIVFPLKKIFGIIVVSFIFPLLWWVPVYLINQLFSR